MVEALTGGCQCGAIRYALASKPVSSTICHCRMCQKAGGGPFLVSATVPATDLTWTRGQPASFQSSSAAARDFCASCGTPLTFRYTPGKTISVGLGTLDEPGLITPDEQIAVDSRLHWWQRASEIPEMAQPMPDLASYQHPDRDTPPDWTSPRP